MSEQTNRPRFTLTNQVITRFFGSEDVDRKITIESWREYLMVLVFIVAVVLVAIVGGTGLFLAFLVDYPSWRVTRAVRRLRGIPAPENERFTF